MRLTHIYITTVRLTHIYITSVRLTHSLQYHCEAHAPQFTFITVRLTHIYESHSL